MTNKPTGAGKLDIQMVDIPGQPAFIKLGPVKYDEPCFITSVRGLTRQGKPKRTTGLIGFYGNWSCSAEYAGMHGLERFEDLVRKSGHDGAFKYIAEWFGWKFIQRWNATQYTFWLKPWKETGLISRLAREYRTNRLDLGLTAWMKNNRELVLQTYKDGNERLIPVLFRHKVKSLTELRENYGKGKWKQICSCSRTHIKEAFLIQVQHSMPGNLVSLPPRVLRNLNNQNRDTIGPKTAEFFNFNKKKIKFSDRDEVNKIVEFVEYIGRAGQELEDPNIQFNPRWSPRRLQEEHDRLSLLLQEKYARDKNIELHTEFPNTHNTPLEFELEGLKAIKLNTVHKCLTQGSDQHHCIGGYYGMAKEEKAHLYSIQDGDVIISSVMYDKNGIKVQHYAKFNKIVTDERANKLALILEGVLFSRLKVAVKPVNQGNGDAQQDDVGF